MLLRLDRPVFATNFGAKIFISAANKKEDGTLEAATISVGGDGMASPM